MELLTAPNKYEQKYAYDQKKIPISWL